MIFPCVPWIDFNIFTILRNERGNKALLENNIPWSFVFFFVPVQWPIYGVHMPAGNAPGFSCSRQT
jgi:hypothetical protein